MTEPIYTDPDGNTVSVQRGKHSKVISYATLTVFDPCSEESVDIHVPASRVHEAATKLVTALFEGCGLPAPELVTPVGADNPGQPRTTPYDDDWQPYEAGRAVSTQAGDDRG